MFPIVPPQQRTHCLLLRLRYVSSVTGPTLLPMAGSASLLFASCGCSKVCAPPVRPPCLGGDLCFLFPGINEDTGQCLPQTASGRDREGRHGGEGAAEDGRPPEIARQEFRPEDLCCCLYSCQEANTLLFNFPWQGLRRRVAASLSAGPQWCFHLPQPQVDAPHPSQGLAWKHAPATAPAS